MFTDEHDIPASQPSLFNSQSEVLELSNCGFCEDALLTVSRFLDDPKGEQRTFESFLNEKAKQNTFEAGSEEEQELQAKVGEDNMVDQLKAALAANDFGLRTPLGQKFSAFLMTTPEAMPEYAKLSGKAGTRQLKQDFRIKWAQTQLNSD